MKKAVFSLKIILILTLYASFSSCGSTKVIEQVPVYVHDTLNQKILLHDSIYIDRWHTEYMKGDTVYILDTFKYAKYITRYDTVYFSVEKPVTVTRTETVEVKKPLRWWQKTLMWTGVVGLVSMAGIIVWRTRK